MIDSRRRLARSDSRAMAASGDDLAAAMVRLVASAVTLAVAVFLTQVG
jgi:hypothetical protein